MTRADGVPYNREDDERWITALVEERVLIDQDVIAMSERTWAIHGYIAYDGQVIAATFATEKEAWAGLARVEEIEHSTLRGQPLPHRLVR